MALVFPTGIDETGNLHHETIGPPSEQIIGNNYSTNPSINNTAPPCIINETGNVTIPTKPELKPFIVDYIWDGTQWATVGGWVNNTTNTTTNSTNNTI